MPFISWLKLWTFVFVESESYIFCCPGFPEGCMDRTSDPRSPSPSDAYQVNGDFDYDDYSDDDDDIDDNFDDDDDFDA